MKRSFISVIAVALLVAGCSGGNKAAEGGANLSLAGPPDAALFDLWTFHSNVTATTCQELMGIAVGASFEDIIRVSQKENGCEFKSETAGAAFSDSGPVPQSAVTCEAGGNAMRVTWNQPQQMSENCTTTFSGEWNLSLNDDKTGLTGNGRSSYDMSEGCLQLMTNLQNCSLEGTITGTRGVQGTTNTGAEGTPAVGPAQNTPATVVQGSPATGPTAAGGIGEAPVAGGGGEAIPADGTVETPEEDEGGGSTTGGGTGGGPVIVLSPTPSPERGTMGGSGIETTDGGGTTGGGDKSGTGKKGDMAKRGDDETTDKTGGSDKGSGTTMIPLDQRHRGQTDIGRVNTDLIAPTASGITTVDSFLIWRKVWSADDNRLRATRFTVVSSHISKTRNAGGAITAETIETTLRMSYVNSSEGNAASRLFLLKLKGLRANSSAPITLETVDTVGTTTCSGDPCSLVLNIAHDFVGTPHHASDFVEYTISLEVKPEAREIPIRTCSGHDECNDGWYGFCGNGACSAVLGGLYFEAEAPRESLRATTDTKNGASWFNTISGGITTRKDSGGSAIDINKRKDSTRPSVDPNIELKKTEDSVSPGALRNDQKPSLKSDIEFIPPVRIVTAPLTWGNIWSASRDRLRGVGLSGESGRITKERNDKGVVIRDIINVDIGMTYAPTIVGTPLPAGYFLIELRGYPPSPAIGPIDLTTQHPVTDIQKNAVLPAGSSIQDLAKRVYKIGSDEKSSSTNSNTGGENKTSDGQVLATINPFSSSSPACIGLNCTISASLTYSFIGTDYSSSDFAKYTISLQETPEATQSPRLTCKSDNGCDDDWYDFCSDGVCKAVGGGPYFEARTPAIIRTTAEW